MDTTSYVYSHDQRINVHIDHKVSPPKFGLHGTSLCRRSLSVSSVGIPVSALGVRIPTSASQSVQFDPSTLPIKGDPVNSPPCLHKLCQSTKHAFVISELDIRSTARHVSKKYLYARPHMWCYLKSLPLVPRGRHHCSLSNVVHLLQNPLIHDWPRDSLRRRVSVGPKLRPKIPSSGAENRFEPSELHTGYLKVRSITN